MAQRGNTGEGYTVEASGFADELVRFEGHTIDDRTLTKSEAEATAKGYALQLRAEHGTKPVTGARITVRRNGQLVRMFELSFGLWYVTAQITQEAADAMVRLPAPPRLPSFARDTARPGKAAA